MPQSVLLILSRQPYDGTDVTWNALRLAERLLKDRVEARLFVMNDAVDLLRDSSQPPEGFFDLVQMLKELIAKGVTVKACTTCQGRCGLNKGQPYFDEGLKSNMAQLSEWIQTSDKVLTF